MTGIDRQKRLRDFIEPIARQPVKWGRDDCTAMAARWVSSERGIDIPIPDYSSEASALDMISNAGSLEAIWSRALRLAGVFETVAPAYGDVGIVDTGRFGPVGVIFCIDGLALWRSESGVSIFRPRNIIKAWAV